MTNKQIEQYKDLLCNDKTTYDEVCQFVDAFRPQKLYRFMRFNSHWRDNILDGAFYLGLASSFNDPFDCLVYINPVIYAEHLSIMAKICYPSASIDAIVESAADAISTHLKSLLEDMRKKIRVACLTEDPQSPLMWAHYTDNHNGFCIEYDLDKLDDGFRNHILPVIYSDERYDGTKAAIIKSNTLSYVPLYFKSSCWSYEKEWRMVVPDILISDADNPNASPYADFSKAITGVYLGLKSTERHQAEIAEICSQYKKQGRHVYQMDIESRSYKLIPRIIV